jgi:hypothetical protein
MAELIEVERAIAALEGRNVENAEHLVVLRRDAEQRKAALERTIAAAREDLARRRRLLPFKIAGGVVALAAAAFGAVKIAAAVTARNAERDRAVAAATRAAKPFEGRFSIARTAAGGEPLVLSASPGQCFVVVGSGVTEAARVTVERDGVTREASGSVGFCACKSEEARVTLSGQEPAAAVVLQAPAAAIGGADVLAAVAPKPAAVFGEAVDRACAEASFEAWASAQRPEPARPDPEHLTREEQALLSGGFRMAALAAEDAPFVVPPAASDVCLVALSRKGAALALHRKGGERAFATKRGALGACLKDATGWSVRREGDGEIALFSSPRPRAGGLLGLREHAARAGVPIAVWTPPAELDDDARAALSASGIAVTPGGPGAEHPAVFALSTDLRSTLTPSSGGKEVVCKPPLDVGAMQAFCIEARAGAMEAAATLPPGAAKGPVPLWLALPAAPDHAALERALDLLAFARRMSAEGFELTSLVGATLTAKGAEITGRSGEKEIVALVISSEKPFVHTLSEGAAWPLESPRATLLSPGQTVSLVATPKYAGAAKREYVVWRR